jgi:ABC-2 type transport system permease protein
VNKTWLIARHEFVNTIRRKAFIILTLAFPVVALLGMLAGQVISSIEKPATVTKDTIGYVDKTDRFTEITNQDSISLKKYADENAAKQALLDKKLKEFFVIPPDYLETGMVQRYTLDRELEPGGQTTQVIRNFLLHNLLKDSTSPDVISRVQAPLNLISTLLTETGEIAPNQGGFASFIVPYIFSILLLISIFFSSGYLLQGLGEEKENRVMEILLSSVSSKQLLAGKVIGLGAVGLLQIIVWLVSAQFLARIASSNWGNVIGQLQIPTDFLILGTVYFIFGYLLFAVIMAGVGAVSPTAREGQQLSTLFTLTAVVPLWFMAFIIDNPYHIVARLLMFFPVTAPITFMIRYGLIDIPAWELGLSMLLMVVAIAGCFVLAVKLFRTFLLMYGKRPDFRDIWKSFKSA